MIGKKNTLEMDFPVEKVRKVKAPKAPKEPRPEKAPKGEKVKDKSADTVWPSAAKPSAVLVPRYIRESRALASTRRVSVWAVGLLVCALVLGVAGSFLLAATAKGDLSEAQAARDAKLVEVKKLSKVAAIYDGLDSRRKSVADVMGRDIAYDKILKAIASSLPAGADIAGLTMSVGTACPGPNPFEVTSALGCIQFNGTTRSNAASGRFIDSLNTDHSGLLTGAYASSIADSDGTSSFTATVNFTPKAYTYKYTKAAEPKTTTTPAPTTPPTPAPTDGNN